MDGLRGPSQSLTIIAQSQYVKGTMRVLDMSGINHSDPFDVPLSEFCVVLFGQICVRFRQVIVFVPQLYDMLYWCKTMVGLYLGYLETTQNSLNS